MCLSGVQRSNEEAKAESIARYGFFVDDEGHIVIDTSKTGPKRLQDISAIDTVRFRNHIANTCPHTYQQSPEYVERMGCDFPKPLYGICSKCSEEFEQGPQTAWTTAGPIRFWSYRRKA